MSHPRAAILLRRCCLFLQGENQELGAIAISDRVSVVFTILPELTPAVDFAPRTVPLQGLLDEGR
jgi:hypothetical protein